MKIQLLASSWVGRFGSLLWRVGSGHRKWTRGYLCWSSHKK